LAAVTGRFSFIAKQKPTPDKLTENQISLMSLGKRDYMKNQWIEVAQHRVHLAVEISKFRVLMPRILCKVDIKEYVNKIHTLTHTFKNTFLHLFSFTYLFPS
jgi:hypothetical protein